MSINEAVTSHTSRWTVTEPPVHYTDSGTAGAAVIFNHGFFMDARMFAPQVDLLKDSYRVISVDARGHGQTVTQGKTFDYWDLARDLLHVMDDADVEAAHLVGHSQGGFTAMRAALLAPSRVLSLTLLSSEAAANTPDQIAEYRSLFELWDGEVPEAVTDQLALQLVGDAEAARPWSSGWSTIDRDELRLSADALMSRDDVTEQVSEIAVPVTLILGTEDKSFHATTQGELASAFSSTHVVVHRVEGATHASNLSHPDAVTKIIEDFLAEVDGRPDARRVDKR